MTETAEIIFSNGDVIELSESEISEIMTWIDKKSLEEDYGEN